MYKSCCAHHLEHSYLVRSVDLHYFLLSLRVLRIFVQVHLLMPVCNVRCHGNRYANEAKFVDLRTVHITMAYYTKVGCKV